MNMIRRIIEIDRDACTGCGICVEACHEGAIGLENGKAILYDDSYKEGPEGSAASCPSRSSPSAARRTSISRASAPDAAA